MKTLEVPDSGLSLVIPAYGEAAVIGRALHEAIDALQSLEIDYEILVIDDGSNDDTAAVAEQIAAHAPEVQVIRHSENRGYGAALRTGFEQATKSLIAFTDADCQFDLRELDRLVMLADDYDIACGYRIDRQDPVKRRFASGVYNILVRSLLGTRVRDCDCALKVFHHEVLDAVRHRSDGFLVNAEILTLARHAGFSIVEVGVTHRRRLAGESTVSLMHSIPVFVALLAFWWRTEMFPAESREAQETWPRRLRWGMGIGLGAIAGLLLFVNLGYPLFEPDETRYAQIALEMHESGNFIVPTLRGEPYLDKPPLLYWLICASYRVFGPSPWAARLPSAVAGWLMVMTTFVIGRRLVGGRSAWSGSVLLLLCSGFVLSSRFLIMDGVLALFTTVGLLAIGCALQSGAKSMAWWLTAGFACGFGVLTKGPLAAVICLPPAIAIALLSEKRLRPAWSSWLAFATPAILVAAPWFLAISIKRPEFISYFFLKHNLLRFANAFDHQQSWWFYIPVLAIGMFPASLMLPIVLRYLFGRDEHLRNRRTGSHGFLCAAGLWVLLFFSLSTCKLPTYILPALPVLSLVLGKAFSDVIHVPNVEPFFRVCAQRAGLVATLVALTVGIAGASVNLVLGGAANLSITVAIAFSVVLLVRLVLLTRGDEVRRLISPASVGAICFVVGLNGFGIVLPEFASWRSNIHNAAGLRAELGGDIPVVFIGRRRDSASLYIPSRDIVEFEPDELDGFRSFVADHKVAVVVASPECAAQIAELRSQRLILRPQQSSRRRNLYTVRSAVPFIATSDDGGTIR